jgi:hypothetical protein
MASAIEALRNMGFTNNKFEFVVNDDNNPQFQYIAAEVPARTLSSSGQIRVQTGNSLGGGNTGHIHIQSGRGKTP